MIIPHFNIEDYSRSSCINRAMIGWICVDKIWYFKLTKVLVYRKIDHYRDILT